MGLRFELTLSLPLTTPEHGRLHCCAIRSAEVLFFDDNGNR
jgi:hypothetical protein